MLTWHVSACGGADVHAKLKERGLDETILFANDYRQHLSRQEGATADAARDTEPSGHSSDSSDSDSDDATHGSSSSSSDDSTDSDSDSDSSVSGSSSAERTPSSEVSIMKFLFSLFF
jgi:cobalamin biosynthesis Mg chelatase CobN